MPQKVIRSARRWSDRTILNQPRLRVFGLDPGDELVKIWERDKRTALFVSIDDAIFLGDEVVVMSPGPGAGSSIGSRSICRGRGVSR